MVTGTGSAARPCGSARSSARCSDIAPDVRHAPERSRHARHQITVAPIAVLATGASNHHIHAMTHTVNARHTPWTDARRNAGYRPVFAAGAARRARSPGADR
ncbi:hypothetical protein [Jatrophihabitans lederbergiae]|uniref:Uncharacterized protein n=1 Tax=Jatrophihabitans lederbergiae TaxID=3075547 RepID=A0ABU2J6F0_9ACTN|nr:hypothetical protein [Jatrophihabitans sp. DSM 44399]MDT0260562.1 hypothetical protein [Jatrophihabitans sp. DSM 44399]